jgi:hypothetical protein
MTNQNASAELLRALGIDPNTVERYLIEHQVGRPPTLTVWHIVQTENWQKAVSEFIKVYQLAQKPAPGTEAQ